jgi:hypothetical protein
VSYRQGKHFAELSLNIATSYPSTAGVQNWQRTVRLNRGSNVTVKDVVSLNKAEQVTEHLMTCYPAEVKQPGQLVIHYKPKTGIARDFVIRYNAKQMTPVVEKIPLVAMEDKGILQKWGDNIYRINFTVTATKPNDTYSFVIALL